MKQEASISNDKPNHILTFATPAAPDEVKARLPDADTIKRLLCRTRASYQPKDPETLQVLVIDNQWAQTVGENPTNFLHYGNELESDERVLVFATREHLPTVCHLVRLDIWTVLST